MFFHRRVASLIAVAWFLTSHALFARDQEFHFDKPDAQSVALVGEFNQWHAQAMAKESDGSWTIKIPLAPGTYAYKFLVNGTDWVFDPKNPNRKKIDGIENSSLEVGSSDASPAPTTPAVASARAPATPLAVSSFTPSQARSPQFGAPRTTAELSPTPGTVLVVEVKLSAAEQADAAKEGNAHLTTAKLAMSVPPGFDPQKSWPILVINNTLNFANADSMNQFKEAANNEGWISLAADPIDAEKDEHAAWRWPCLAAGLDYMVAAWPGAKDWPIALGGMSGGGKNSAFIAADVARAHYRLIGILMMGCNQDMATVAFRKSTPPRFLGVPIFLSSGIADTIATPAQHEEVKNSMKGTGFQKVRLESHSGAHDIYQPHISAALKWFMAESSSGPKPAPASSFDNFFKKKP
jgi:hypothetical protein